jgi:two-component system CheB/CheR fusion protein
MSKQAFPIVGIGASAGGLEAVTDLVANLPATTGMAFVYIQHLSPDHPSLLTEILARKTPLTVVEAQEGLAVQPDHLFILPAGATLTLRDGVLHLEHQARATQPPTNIDRFLQSLAEERDNAIAILLSGTGSDGVQGIQAIKAAGGIVFAQEPASAKFGEMPGHAIGTGCVDLILPPADIARHLACLAQQPYLTWDAAAGVAAPPPDLAAPSEAESWKRIFRALRAASGIDFSNYKGATLRRRLERRMALRQSARLVDYAQRVQEDPAEARALADDFLIRVTRFFREPEAFDALAQFVFPGLLRDRPEGEPVRIWVPGCASGEEVYSLAISLCEILEDQTAPPPIQIFGTDVSDRAIEQARAGEYPDGIAVDVSPEQLQRFFVKEGTGYRISKSIRDLCIFARQNVLADPPFSRMDLVSCRNLLIYFDPVLQRQALALFHYALKPGGVLLLGPAETVGQTAEDFDVVDPRQRLYRRKAGLAPPPPTLRPADAAAVPRVAPLRLPLPPAPALAERVRKEGDRILLARYTPASVLVDRELNIVQFRGHTAPYLEHVSGAASLNLQKLAPPELLIALTAAIETAHQEKIPVRGETQVERADRVWPVRFEVVPLPAGEAEGRHTLIILHDAPEPEPPAAKATGFRATWWNRLWATGESPSAATAREAALKTLGRELEASRYAMRTLHDEQAASQEQLNAAHEELVSANEELQSTNEELESAKEELQAANEELSTTNDELRHRNQELNDANETLHRARDYADSIIDTVREGLLVLDGELRIRRVNRTFCEMFRTRREDTRDRFLFTLGDGQWNIPQLQTLLKAVRGEGAVVEAYEVMHDFPGLGERTMLLNARGLAGTASNEPHLLLAIEDITERKRAECQLREDDRHKDEFLAMLAHELRNPLAPIRNAVQVMRVIGLSHPKLEWARQVIDRQLQQLVHLVDDLLDAARIRQNKISLKPARLDLGTILGNVIEISQPLITANHQELIVAIPPTVPPIEGDPLRLAQAIGNLLNNAAKYTPEGGTIGLTVEATATEVTVRVKDNGVGIDPALLPRIFDLFAQGDSSLDRTQGGLGIGLSLVRHIAERHGGTVEAFSAGLGQGSEFVLRLPAAPAVEPTAPPAGPEQPPAPAAPHRILVVDDNVDTAESLAVFLTLKGHQVQQAHEGASALEAAATFKPEVVVLDIGLPEMSGYELAERLRSVPETRHAYLIAITGYGQPQDRQQSKEAGIDAHWVKPVDPEALNQLIVSLETPNPSEAGSTGS